MNLHCVISFLFNGLTTVFDILLYPIYFAWYQPWKELKKRRTPRSTVNFTSENEVIIKSVAESLTKEVRANQPFVENVYELFKLSSNKHAEKLCSGTRKILKQVIEQDTQNIAAQKFLMEDAYRWYSYKSIQNRIDNVSLGLISGTCVKSKDVVVFYADTCLEWFISAMACFKINCKIATIYTNLGQDGVRYCINKVKPKLIITTQQLLPNLLDILGKKSNYPKEIIYFPTSFNSDNIGDITVVPWIVHNFDDIENFGKDSDKAKVTWKAAKRDDVAMIMFTSGSTGNPKGVVLSHDNIIEGVYGFQIKISNDVGYADLSNETYVAYLPLAHIFELMVELLQYSTGVRVAYSSPFTLTEKSPKIAKGQKGDLALIQPTLMVAVPLVLNRVYKNIRSAVENKNPLFSQLFKLSFEYKRYWRERGMDTPLLNALIFKKISNALGGKLRVLYCGGAPLSNDIYHFFRLVMCPTTITGYGLTESCGNGIQSNNMDPQMSPQDGFVIKLQSWKEGSYLVNDKNQPGGEILLSSRTVAKGYYKLEDELSNASFFTDSEGVEWFRTGDIGQLDPISGTLRIVDRRKDLIKLQMGEYVSLSKVESEIKMHPMVDMVCVYADPMKVSTIAFIIPDDTKLSEMANQCKISHNTASRKDLCNNPLLTEHVLKDLKRFVTGKLQKFEIPKEITLVNEMWNPESGLVTAAMKLKRKAIQNAYQHDIDKMYRKIDQSKSIQFP